MEGVPLACTSHISSSSRSSTVSSSTGTDTGMRRMEVPLACTFHITEKNPSHRLVEWNSTVSYKAGAEEAEVCI